MAGSKAATGRQAIFGTAILLAKSAKFSRDQIVDQLRAIVAQAGAGVRLVDGGSGKGGFLSALRERSTEIRVEIAGVRLLIRNDSRPLCSANAVHGFINPSVWQGTIGDIAGHRAHILIAEDDSTAKIDSRDALFDRATAVTLATAAVASVVDAVAVVWLPARNAVPMGTFGSEMERFMDGQAPLQLWIRWQALPPPLQQEMELGKLSGEALNPGIATIGMAAFLGAEIVAPPSRVGRDVMLDQVFALASAVIDESAELQDGGAYGRPGDLLIRIHGRKSGPYSERPYWEAVPVMAPAAKPAPATSAATGPAEGPEPSAANLLNAGPGDRPEDTPVRERHLRLVVPGK